MHISSAYFLSFFLTCNHINPWLSVLKSNVKFVAHRFKTKSTLRFLLAVILATAHVRLDFME